MGDLHQRISSLDREMLAAAYWPAVVFTAVLIAARILLRRRTFQAGP